MGDGGGECARWLLDKVARIEINIKKICRRASAIASHFNDANKKLLKNPKMKSLLLYYACTSSISTQSSYLLMKSILSYFKRLILNCSGADMESWECACIIRLSTSFLGVKREYISVYTERWVLGLGISPRYHPRGKEI